MTPKRQRQLMELLEEASVGEGRLPYAVWKKIHTLLPLPAVELFVPNERGEVALTWRNDEDWHGWHVPGAHVLRGDKSFLATCNRIARKELGLRGVRDIKQIGIMKWRKHPFNATPISILMVGQPIGELRESKTMRYFAEPPGRLVLNHKKLFCSYQSHLKTSSQGAQIIAAA